ncbi:MAG TPA: hypothetical protein VK525_22260 [Candidatus Saccharimonadales bacterium]|nr:hypothetical protein [Candidatus Saccharimonadales bacterium]
MRGTIGGAPIWRIGAVGFATVAIGVGPFVYSSDVIKSCKISVPVLGRTAYFLRKTFVVATGLLQKTTEKILQK